MAVLRAYIPLFQFSTGELYTGVFQIGTEGRVRGMGEEVLTE